MDTTRKKWKCPLFGNTCDLKDNMLPTYEDVMKYYEWNRRNIKLDRDTKKEPTYKEIQAIVVSKITEIWGKASIPTIERKGINVMLKAYHLKCKNLLKSHPKIPTAKLDEFRRSSRVLFDISSCKCTDISKCTCSREKKVPAREQSFLIDQRSTRKMFIGTIDTVTSKKLTNALKRKSNSKLQPQNEITLMPYIPNSSETESTTSTTDQDDNFESPKKKFTTPLVKKVSSESVIDYDLLSKTCDRYGVSDRAAAAIAYCILRVVLKLLIKTVFAGNVTSQENVP